MFQRIYRQIKAVSFSTVVTIAASKSQVSTIHSQAGRDIDISVEPCRRDTFAAIALATAYIHDVKGTDENDAVVVCPVDPYVDESCFECVKELYEAAQGGSRSLFLMGIEPTYPSEKYGYIRPVTDGGGEPRFAFTEKPTAEKAAGYIA